MLDDAPPRAGRPVPARRAKPSSARFSRGRRTLPRAVGALAEAPTPAIVARRERAYRSLLVAADGFAALLALYVAVTVAGDDRLRPGALLVVPLVVVASKLVGLYDRDELVLKKTTLEESGPLFQLATIFTLTAWLLDSVLIDGYLGNKQVLGLWGCLFVASLFGRTVAREVGRRLTPSERCLLVGNRGAMEQVVRGLEDTRRVKAEVVGHMRLDGSVPHHRLMAQLQEAILAGGVHRVVLAPDRTDSDEFLDMISLVKSLGVRVSVLPRIFEVVGTAVEFDTINGVTVLGIRRFGLMRSSRALKRAMDVVGSVLALVALSPLMLAIAIAIRVTSRGPILFRQTRVGRDGKRFTMLKFRTMVDGADAIKARLAAHNEAVGLFKIAQDPRVTRVGRLLRCTSLDELPQLVNVLRGEMSLVGPRPLVVDEDSKIEGRHRRRLHLTPGMTGDWQILGSARIPLHEMVKIDYLYVTNWSLWGDVKILARTILYVFRARSC